VCSTAPVGSIHDTVQLRVEEGTLDLDHGNESAKYSAVGDLLSYWAHCRTLEKQVYMPSCWGGCLMLIAHQSLKLY